MSEKDFIFAIKLNIRAINNMDISYLDGMKNIFALCNEAEKQGYNFDIGKLLKELNHNKNNKDKIKYLQDCSTLSDIVEKLVYVAKNNPNVKKDVWNEYVDLIKTKNNIALEEAINIAERNIGYFMGYFDAEKRDLIYKTYNLNHPVFGQIIEY